MKIITLIGAAMLSCGANATEIFETPLDNGMDNAIVKAFSDATSANVTDPSHSLSLEDIRTTIETISINGNNLSVSFNDEKIQNLLSSKGIGVWNGEAGTIVAWIADLSASDSPLLSGDGNVEFVNKLQNFAQQNKLNIMFPVMDLDDVQQVNSQTIVSHSDELIANASKRYDAKYFVSGVMERDSSNDSYSVKWNLCDAQGKSLGSGANSGDADTASSQMSSQIAQVLMNSANSAAQSSSAPQATSANEAETITPVNTDGSIELGPVKGGVRVMITDIQNVADYPRIKRILITYGYESDIQVLGYNSEGVIFLIPTGSSPAILDGTFTHASEFTKVAPWTYRFNESKGAAKPAANVGSVTTTTSQRVTSSINNFGNEAYTRETVKETVEVTTTAPAPAKAAGDTSNDVPVITITDDSDNSSVALEK